MYLYADLQNVASQSRWKHSHSSSRNRTREGQQNRVIAVIIELSESLVNGNYYLTSFIDDYIYLYFF